MAVFQNKIDERPEMSKISQQIIKLNNSYNKKYKNTESTKTLVTGFQEFIPYSTASNYDYETDEYACYYEEKENNNNDDGDDEDDESDDDKINELNNNTQTSTLYDYYFYFELNSLSY